MGELLRFIVSEQDNTWKPRCEIHTTSDYFMEIDEHRVIWQATILGDSAQFNVIHSGKHSNTHIFRSQNI